MAPAPDPAQLRTGHCHCNSPPPGNNPPSPSTDDDSTLSTDDDGTWGDACKFYKNGFIDVISPQLPHIPAWASKLYGQATNNPQCLPASEDDFSCTINFADMQRFNMRRLQARLIDFAFSQRFDDDKGLSKANVFESTLKEYGRISRAILWFLRGEG